MNTADLAQVVSAAMTFLEAASPELADLDATVGDGDLGITVSGSTRAVRDALGGLPTEATNADLVAVVSSTLATSNPSTLSTLTSAGLRSAGRGLDQIGDLTAEDWLDFGAAVAAAIARLGKSAPGDKTVLDAVLPSLEAAGDRRDPPQEILARMISGARHGVASSRESIPRRGRAAWQGERAAGHEDPGAVAYLRLLEAIARALDERSQAD